MSIANSDDRTKQILAQVLYGLNSTNTPEQWLNYINNCKTDEDFFGANKQGLDEYTRFRNNFDRDNYVKNVKNKLKKGK